jgi:hypothetical protein
MRTEKRTRETRLRPHGEGKAERGESPVWRSRVSSRRASPSASRSWPARLVAVSSTDPRSLRPPARPPQPHRSGPEKLPCTTILQLPQCPRNLLRCRNNRNCPVDIANPCRHSPPICAISAARRCRRKIEPGRLRMPPTKSKRPSQGKTSSNLPSTSLPSGT